MLMFTVALCDMPYGVYPLFNEAYVLADLLVDLLFSLVEDHLVLLEQVTSFGVNRYNQRAELLHATELPRSPPLR